MPMDQRVLMDAATQGFEGVARQLLSRGRAMSGTGEFTWLESLAETGDASAMVELANHLARDSGKLGIAIAWYRRAADPPRSPSEYCFGP